MLLSWNSKKGVDRKTNNDFLGVLNDKNHCVCFLFDAASRTEKSNKFCKNWVLEFITLLAKYKSLSSEVIIKVLQDNHESLRRQYVSEIASYTCVYLNKQTAEVLSLGVGDCRVGNTSHLMDGIKWKTQVHTLANILGQDVTVDILNQNERNILTRSLNARRFETPELKSFSRDNAVILATDGYWVDYENQNNSGSDDASYLMIEFCQTDFQFESNSSAQNFYVLDLEAK